MGFLFNICHSELVEASIKDTFLLSNEDQIWTVYCYVHAS